MFGLFRRSEDKVISDEEAYNKVNEALLQDNKPDFDKWVEDFKTLSPRAKLTLMYRLIVTMDTEVAERSLKYIEGKLRYDARKKDRKPDYSNL